MNKIFVSLFHSSVHLLEAISVDPLTENDPCHVKIFDDTLVNRNMQACAVLFQLSQSIGTWAIQRETDLD